DTGGAAADAAQPAAAFWRKDPSPFIQHPTNLETRLETLHGLITPNELFFVRNHSPTPTIDIATYRLRVAGDAVARPLALTYDELVALPSRSVIAYVECAGNWRGFFGSVLGKVASGVQWGTGGIGCAEWTGVPLRAVLELAGVRPDAVDVNLVGLDEGAFSRPMPLAKALDPDTLLVYAMNGAPLPPDHGFPIRAVLPGWVGGSSVKWIGEIQVSAQHTWVKNNTTSYVLIGPEWPADQYAPAEGAPITTQTIKSALALPWPATLPRGRQILQGYAHSPHGRITHVEWRVAEADPWQRARVLEPTLPHAWAQFEFAWEPRPGSHVVTVRATDERGNTQPDTVPFNEKGYLLNIPLPHPIEVT
ncbi:MAG: sulfite oxidase, partial [Gemmatimonadota bacterium]|nr:sulfite oxidase [Gemmatimonadota bacterium]